MIKWCVNSMTGEIFSYIEEGEYNDFPRGTFLAYGDYLTTGLKNKKDAETWAKEWSVCSTCKTTRPGISGDKCSRCNTTLINYFDAKGGDYGKKENLTTIESKESRRTQ